MNRHARENLAVLERREKFLRDRAARRGVVEGGDFDLKEANSLAWAVAMIRRADARGVAADLDKEVLADLRFFRDLQGDQR